MNEASDILILARQITAGSELRDALKLLQKLDELSDNIEDAVETFSLHFRVAGYGNLPTEVKSQFELLDKAKRGRSAANEAHKQLARLVEMFPEDKTAKRALKDADVMIARFDRHEVQARKVVGQLSKKATPAALKKYAMSVLRMLKGKVVDPKAITVKPWMKDTYHGVTYQMVIFVDVGGELLGGGQFQGGKARLTLGEASYERNPPGVYDGNLLEQKSPKEAVNDFVKSLKGWSGLKSEQGNNRAEVTDGVKRALNLSTKAMNPYDREEAEVYSPTRLSASYRSGNLPKEGAYEEGEYRYREMVDEEIGSFKKVVDRNLRSYMKDIEKVSYHDGEKSWIYVEVEMK